MGETGLFAVFQKLPSDFRFFDLEGDLSHCDEQSSGLITSKTENIGSPPYTTLDSRRGTSNNVTRDLQGAHSETNTSGATPSQNTKPYAH